MLINDEQFRTALDAAYLMTDRALRAEAGSGVSRSYYVVHRARTFPLKAVLRLAYKRAGIEFDGPQSADAARALRGTFNIIHLTNEIEANRLERQRLSAERWSRDGRFRTAVLELYGSTCAVSGCTARDAIDAAHLLGVGDAGDDQPENGIVLRADIHRLFDAKPAQMSIDPSTMTVHFSDECREHYRPFDRKQITLPDGGPTPASFSAHWEAFTRDKEKPTG